MNTVIKNLKKKIKQVIKNSPNLNQTIVAAKIGISQPYLNEILNDHKAGTMELLCDIGNVVGIPIQDWLSGSEASKIVPENKEEEDLLLYFRGLDTQKRFLLLNIAADYYKYCQLVRDGKIKPE